MPDKPYTPSQALLLGCLKNPGNVTNLNAQQWSLLLRMARVCKLVAHLAWLIEQHKLSHHVPEKVNNHFQAAYAIISYRRRMAFWEMNRLQRALADINTDIIVLKGCAYLLMGMPFADTRVFADVDLMVDKSKIDTIEKILLAKNWQPLKLDDYDQYYYRQWMHEIPPLRHYSREMEVDIHHTIIPTTSGLQPDPKLLLKDAIHIDSNTSFKVLAPCDMLLHSAVHLFFDSDLNNKLRDLVDLNQLLRHFSATNNDFFQALLLRAKELGLQRPLYYSLRYSHSLLDTPVPDDILQHSQAFAPSLAIRTLMDRLVPIALLPEHPDDASKTVAFARWLLFIRSHYLRMPLKLLIPHLTRKSWVRLIHKESVN
jgi:Uncharacterised nucleotidyltransferase